MLVRVIAQTVSKTAPLAALAGISLAGLRALGQFTSPDAPRGSPRTMKARLYPSHQPTTALQKSMIAVGSALLSLSDPANGDHIAALGDATSNGFLKSIRQQMLADPTGRRILKERPQVSFTSEQWEELKELPKGSFGRTYYRQMKRNGISWTTRAPVKFVDNEEDAYILERLRQCHDFYHALLDMDISVVEELAIKVVEWRQTGLPVSLLAGMFGPLRLPMEEKTRFFGDYLPWAMQVGGNMKPLVNVYWEEMWETPVEEVRERMGIWLLPGRNSQTKAEAKAKTIY